MKVKELKGLIGLSVIILMITSFKGYAPQSVSRDHTSVSVVQIDANVQQIQKAAEDKHKMFANQLTEALPKGIVPYFGNAGNSKQFFIDPQNENYKEIWSAGKVEKTLANTANELCKKAIKKEISVKVDFPSESEPEYKGPGKKKGTFVVITTANVRIDVSKKNLPPSVAKNELILTWEVVETKKQMQAILQSIESKFVADFFEEEKLFMQETAERLIKRYFQNLQENRFAALKMPNDLRELADKSVKVEILGNLNDIHVPLPNELNFRVTALPAVNIFVNPAPYMSEDRSRYLDNDAFHTVNLTFDVAFKEDLKSGSITPKIVNPIAFTQPKLRDDLATALPEYKPEPEPVKSAPPEPVKAEQPKPEPVKAEPAKPVLAKSGKAGEYYKVQILSHLKHVPISELPRKYQVKGVEMETFIMGGKTYYQYVVPVGKDMEEARDLRKAYDVLRAMKEKGINDAWIAVYENGERVRPLGESGN